MTHKVRPAVRWVKVTKADDTTFDGGPSRGVLVGTGGTANLIDKNGTKTSDVPLQQGYNPLEIYGVETGGTADDIWILY